MKNREKTIASIATYNLNAHVGQEALMISYAMTLKILMHVSL